MEFLGDTVHYLASFILIISVIVFIHEYGHFWVARRCGVKVESFSIGFGPEIWGWNDRHGTRWKFSVFPLGGYVKMFGDVGAASTPDEKKLKKMTAEEKRGAFHLKPLWAKAAVVSAGPIANFLLAIVILAFFFMYYGRPETTPEIGTVVEDSAAEAAGFQVGDIIMELDGKRIGRFEEIQRIVSLSPDIPLSFVIQRGETLIEGTITPTLSKSTDIFGNEVEIGLIGVASSTVNYKTLGPSAAIIAGVTETYSISVNTLKAVGQMITGTRSTDDLSGVLRIAKYSGQSTEKGIHTVLWFMAVLSINLGLINLFPIPMLDGGHLMYYAIEALSGRPLAERVQEYGFRIGFALLIALMIFATVNDLRHFNIF